LVDALGQEVYSQRIVSPLADNMIAVPTNNLAKGIYYLQILKNDNIKMVKTIKTE